MRLQEHLGASEQIGRHSRIPNERSGHDTKNVSKEATVGLMLRHAGTNLNLINNYGWTLARQLPTANEAHETTAEQLIIAVSQRHLKFKQSADIAHLMLPRQRTCMVNGIISTFCWWST